VDDAVSNCSSGLKKRDALVVENISKNILSGISLSNSIKKEVIFPKSVIGIIQIGEQSGRLSESIVIAKNLIEREDELRKKIISAMTYPLVIGIFSLLLVFGLVRGVLPEIVPMLKGLNTELPFLTKLVIYLSDFVADKGFYIIVVGVSMFFVLPFVYKKVYFIRILFQNIILRVPIFGNIFFNISFSIFSRSFGSMLNARVNIKEAYASVTDSIGLLPLNILLQKCTADISDGKKISKSFEDIGIKVPPYVTGLINAGEGSGTLGISMIRIADIIDNDIDHKLKRLTSLLEPLLMVTMGIVIGTIALSIVMPIYDISKTLQNS